MHTTLARISVVTDAENGIRHLCSLLEAHDECWESSTPEPQTYETTIEYQHSGVDIRRIEGGDYRTHAGTLAVFAAGTRVECEHVSGDAPYRVEYLRLRGPLATDLEQALDVHPAYPLILPQAPVELTLALQKATGLIFKRQPGWHWALLATLAEMTRVLILSRPESMCPAEHMVDRVRIVVEESPHRPWSVKELADLFSVRRAVLWEQFTRETGVTPARWVRQHRIRVAQAMLARGLSVRETAGKMGFSSRQQFARACKTVTGRAPSVP